MFVRDQLTEFGPPLTMGPRPLLSLAGMVLWALRSQPGLSAGGPQITVPFEAFDWCVDTSSTDSFVVGLRELDIGGNDDYTVNLVP